MFQADIESMSVCMVCAGVCEHAELPTCFLFENMVNSGCQVQPQALPAAAMVRLQGAVLDEASRIDRACGKDGKRGGGGCFEAWSSLRSVFDRPLD